MPVMKQSLSSIATDPLRNFKYHVNIYHQAPGSQQSMARLGFMNMSGLSAVTEPIPYREGGDNTTPRKMPGQTQFSDITLSRGVLAGTHQSWYWLKQLFHVNQGGVGGTSPAGTEFRATMDVLVFDHPVTAGNTPAKLKFRVYNVWPSALAYSELDAGSNAVMIEQMTLVHEGFDIHWGGGYLGNDVTDSKFPI